MEASEDVEEVAVAGGGPGDTGVAEEEGKDAAEGGDHDEDGGELGEAMGEGGAERGGVGLLHKDGHHGTAGGKGLLGEEFLPGEDGEDGEVHGYIEDGHETDGEEDGARDGACRVLHFST